jgi:hypothetical protein
MNTYDVVFHITLFTGALWLLIAHVFLDLHFIYDEVFVDLLILFDVIRNARKYTAEDFLQSKSNIASLFTLWLIIIYWIDKSALPVIDVLETFFIFLQALINFCRIVYSTVQTLRCIKRYRNYTVLPQGEQEDETAVEDDDEVVISFESELQHPLVSLIDRAYKNKTSRLFDSDSDGYSLLTIAQRLKGVPKMLLLVETDEHTVGIGISYNFDGGTVQTPSQSFSFHRETDDADWTVVELGKTVATSGIGRFEVHGRSCSMILQEELQSVYFTMRSFQLSADVNRIQIHALDSA